ncbi:PstS family phosphate ABC transporter substrate-binding protein [Haliangium sp.]|uniref:PstS family phosphate ABC transporter substrate-binding protein n=1 Tax=Haliangium sp. TaxID=2663208 RepID=UPI003D13C59B
MKSTASILSLIALAALVGCSKADEAPKSGDEPAAAAKATEKAAGGEAQVIVIDGSSTVLPISQAVAEEFEAAHKARVTVGKSGTGGGFKKFCRGDIVISGASRPVKKSEAEACQAAGIEFIELPVAYDGIAVVVHKNNDWADKMTVDELKKMWEPAADGKVKKWSEIREGWPDKEFHLFGPGLDSGTYDYFTKAIVGEEHSSRTDFQPNEDDNVLVQGVANDELALGFFGYAYYKENTNKLRVVPIDGGDGPIEPSLESVAKGTYQPLSRPIFIYVSKTAAEERPEVAKFVEFYLTEGAGLVEEVGYIPLPEKAYALVRERFGKRTVGSVFTGGSKIGVTIEDLLQGG